MANKTTEERLYNLFREAAGETGGAIQAAALEPAAPRPEETRSASTFDPSSESSVGQSYHGDSAGASSSATQSGGVGGGLESLAEGLFGSALGLAPLIGGIASLFGGGSKPQPVFEKFQLPPPISFEAAETGNGLADADYTQLGLPRFFGDSGAAASSPPPTPAAPGAATGNSAAPQISVNVQAIDAQSFMSYSGEIAKAVRDAMLNLSSINDVVTEL